jgi:nicotinamidase-related amidase
MMNGSGKHIIYRELREIAAREHTALVVWDVQNALVNAIFNKEEFLKNLRSLIEAARKYDIPIAYTKITPLPTRYESPWRLFMSMKRFGVDEPDKLPPFMKPGAPESEIHADVAPAPNDIVLNKHTASIFIGTHFEYMMRSSGIKTLLFTGIATEIGIDSSARDAANRGFYTIVVDDCCSSPDKEMHESALKILRRICLVKNSKDIVKEW